MKKDFLIEIGTEEIPTSYLQSAVDSLQALIKNCLEDNLVSYGKTRIFYSPRRLAVLICEVSTKGKDIKDVITGPPKEVAFKDGEPTTSLIGFARAHKVSPADIKVIEKGRKEVIGIEKVKKGKSTIEILKKALPSIIGAIEFPRNMRWESSGLRFARPIRWIVCLFGESTVDFKIAGIRSGKVSFGLRFNKNISIDKPSKYEALMESGRIIPDSLKRRKEIERQIRLKVKRYGIEWVVDPELLEEVTNMVESPIVVVGRFNPSYLSLPEEIIRTALRGHQRYFWAEKDRKKANYFISVANNPDGDIDTIRIGNERVLESRLEDAKFYWEEDLKISLSSRVEYLRDMLYDTKLGSLYDKTMRLTDLSLFSINWVSGIDTEIIKRAALLSKTDLTTNMIKDGKEFTKLEGIIGAEYARSQGEDVRVVNAIREQYLPGYTNDLLPETPEGTLLSLVDKVDSLVGGYLKVGIPSSSKDPRGMRRIANGIVRIILEKSISLPLDEIIRKDFSLYGKEYNKDVLDFIIQRCKQYMLDNGIEYDIVMAVQERSDILTMKMMADSLVNAGDLEDVILATKRINNILRGLEDFKSKIDEELLIEPDEKELFSVVRETENILDKSIRDKKFSDAIATLRDITPYINRMFDSVLIMADDENIKMNRLALLNYASNLFKKIADFKEIH